MQAIAGMLYARASVTPKRVLRSLRTQKVLATVRQTARATPRGRHGPLSLQNTQYFDDQNTSQKWPAHAHNRAEKLCTRDLVTPKNRVPGSFRRHELRCS